LELALDALEVRRHAVGREVAEPLVARPALEHPVGRAPAGARVDGRRPADEAPRRQRDERVADGAQRAASAVEAPDALEAAAVEVGARVVLPLLGHEAGEPLARELAGDDRAARPGPDDDRVAVEVDVTGDLLPRGHLLHPARALGGHGREAPPGAEGAVDG